MRAAGRPAESEALAGIADTSGRLAQASRERHGRYLGRPPTAAERVDAGLVHSEYVRLAGRRPRPGVDGALYAPGSITGPGGEPHPVAVVFTHAGTTEVITGFRHEHEQAAWLSSRGLDTLNPAAGPLPGTRSRVTAGRVMAGRSPGQCGQNWRGGCCAPPAGRSP